MDLSVGNNNSYSFFHQHGGNIEEEADRLGVNMDLLIDASASLVPFALPTRLYDYLVETIHGAAIKNYPNRNN